MSTATVAPAMGRNESRVTGLAWMTFAAITFWALVWYFTTGSRVAAGVAVTACTWTVISAIATGRRIKKEQENDRPIH